MAIIGMRELLREPTKVFREIEEKREPVLVTHRGRPVAAMYPVDADRAEQLMLASAPDYVESRRSAENARAEGRTRSLGEAIREYNAGVESDERIETEEAEAASAASVFEPNVTAPGELVPMAELQAIFGAKLAGEVAREAGRRISAISESLVSSAEAAGLFEPEKTAAGAESDDRTAVIRRVQALSGQLFGEVMRETLLQAATERVSALGAEVPDMSDVVGPEGMFDKRLADETLEIADARVEQFNGEILGLARSQEVGTLLTTYAASIKGVTAFGRGAHAGASSRDFARRQR